MNNRYKFTLPQKKREKLTGFIHSGKSTAAKFFHARALFLTGVGELVDPWQVADLAKALGARKRTIARFKERFVEERVKAPLGHAVRSKPRAVNFHGTFDARLTSLAYSKAPAGWQC